jgi:hypothetical protein
MDRRVPPGSGDLRGPRRWEVGRYKKAVKLIPHTSVCRDIYILYSDSHSAFYTIMQLHLSPKFIALSLTVFKLAAPSSASPIAVSIKSHPAIHSTLIQLMDLSPGTWKHYSHHEPKAIRSLDRNYRRQYHLHRRARQSALPTFNTSNRRHLL